MKRIISFVLVLTIMLSLANVAFGAQAAVRQTVNVYFTNNKNWANLHYYYWGSDDSSVEWPGLEMTYVELNEHNESVYCATIPADVTGIIFNNGTTNYQTVDITEGITNNAAWYVQGLSNGKYSVDTWTYVDGDSAPKEVFNGHTYQVIDKSMTWTRAVEYCKERGGHLVTITSAEEQAFLTEFSKSSIKKNLWIGARTSGNGVYYWITEEPFSYTNWAYGEPNNIQNYQYTAMMYTQRAAYDAGLWNDENENGRNWTGYYLSDFGFICEWENEIKREDGFNFYMNQDSNNLCVGDTAKLQVGYYKENCIDLSSKGYIYSVSNSSVISLGTTKWSDEFGDCMSITALKEGMATITVTHPTNGETCALEIYVSPRESGYNFYNIPKMSIEPGRTTNFYNFNGMVVDDFAYTEHIDCSGKVDYYIVTMNVFNKHNHYGAVTSYKPDGSIYGYYIIDKLNSHQTSFVDSVEAMYYSFGDIFKLVGNKSYYSGKSITKETNVTIKVPVGGYLEISNNSKWSDVVGVTNFLSLSFEAAKFTYDFATMDVDGDLLDDVQVDILKDVLNEVLEAEALDKLHDTVYEKYSYSNPKFLDVIESVKVTNDSIYRETNIDVNKLIEDSIRSVLSIGESVITKVLPTGCVIEYLYTFADGCDLAVSAKRFLESFDIPVGIYIYAPSDSSKYQSNGICIDTQDDMSKTVVHAYTVIDTSVAGINENTFGNQSIYYSEKFQTYNITLYKNGAEAQPNSTVTVRIPIPDDLNCLNRSALKVYRNNDDGTTTDMNAHVEGNDMVFETDHFSYYSIVDESLPSTSDELAFSGASLTLQDNISINYKANEDLLADKYEDLYVIFEFNGITEMVSEYTILNGKYVFDFSDISPANMNDTVKATLYATYNGTVYQSETREYSVATYCYNMLSKYNADEYAELRTLLVDLLNYGAATQIYESYNTDALVNAKLTAEQQSWGTSESLTYSTVQNLEYKTIDNPTVQWKGGGLNLKDSVEMRFKITADSYENLTVKAETDTHIWTIASDTFEETTGGYYVFFDGLDASQMSEPVYLTVYDGDTAVSNTICYSIESYAYAKQNSTDVNLVNLLEAMMKYGNSANSYIN